MKNELLADCKSKDVYIEDMDGTVYLVFGQNDCDILCHRVVPSENGDGLVFKPLECIPQSWFERVVTRDQLTVEGGEVVAMVAPKSVKKRQSTTAKITLKHVENIEKDVQNGNGVIIRYRRQTLGAIGVERIGGKVFFRVRETSALVPRIGCTIRKTTVAAWNSGAVVTMNVGRKVGKYGLLDDQFVRSRIAYGGVYNASKSFREAVGEWEGADEPTIIATGRTTASRCDLVANIVALADELGQEAIAVEIDGIGSLAWGERGKRNYTFDPAYFIR